MSSELAAYERARAAVLVAQQDLAAAFQAHGIIPCAPPMTGDGEKLPEPADVVDARRALAVAHETLTTAQAPLAVEVEAAWDANREAVADARSAVVQAHKDWIDVTSAASRAARLRRARPEDVPVLSDEEIARCQEAQQRVADAREAHQAAIATFKAGAAAEQIGTG